MVNISISSSIHGGFHSPTGDITHHLCSAAELKFYFNSFFERSGSTNYLKPNKNCNLTSWVEGCEPGWACSVGLYQKVNLNDSKVIPARTLNCQACCEGFFFPHGLTCMIRNPNHTCGGANIWADVGSSSELFCSAGSYCPSTTSRQTCTRWVLHLRKGHPNVKAIHSSKGVGEPPFFSGLSYLFCHQRCHYSCKSRSGL
ncbi:ABC transporter G family member 24-like isoform X2 [Quercus robur]|uniref:ABC transporter G family member 24-like isoform X2 n=1 Tax=Quercus robur TaxID=38942 RepID=UPI002163405E|nr:ABC transporter G family member 24-like isoform X2 [Quercus robur]